MIVIVAKYLIPNGFGGMAIFPFIFLKESKQRQNPAMFLHEKIHLRQQAELLVLPFFVWYLVEYCFRLFQYQNRKLAYRNISFEREAYANESTEGFLRKRKFWNFINYLK